MELETTWIMIMEPQLISDIQWSNLVVKIYILEVPMLSFTVCKELLEDHVTFKLTQIQRYVFDPDLNLWSKENQIPYPRQ